MRYQDLKIRDAGRLALMGLGVALFAVVCIAARATVEPALGHRYWGYVAGMIILCPMSLAVAVWYLGTSPAQNARFIKWAEQNLRQKPGPKFNPALLDAADPNYDVPTFRYWMNKRRRDHS